MHLALSHQGKPLLLRVEGPPGAPLALFFHPFPLHSDVWEEMLRACAASGMCAAAFDAPGFGGTPPLGEPLTMEKLSDLGAAALDTLGAKKAAIVGCSMGGYAAMAFARIHHQRVSALVFIATKASADTEEAKKNRERQASLALESGPAPVLAEFVPKLVAPQAREEVRRRVQELAARATAQGIADALRGMALRRDSIGELLSFKVPALVIAGENDLLIPRAEMERLSAGLPQARMEVIAGAGHLPFLEQPAKVAPLLVSHLHLRVPDSRA